MVQQSFDNPLVTPALDNPAGNVNVFNSGEPHSTYSAAFAAMDASRNKGATGLHDIPIDGVTPQNTSATAQDKFANMTNDQILNSLPKDQADWAREALKHMSNGRIMEGFHKGEIAVGNFQPTQEEKAVLAKYTDQMIAQGKTHGECTLPDGSKVTIDIVKRGSGKAPNPNDTSDDDSYDKNSTTNGRNKDKSKKSIVVETPDATPPAIAPTITV